MKYNVEFYTYHSTQVQVGGKDCFVVHIKDSPNCFVVFQNYKIGDIIYDEFSGNTYNIVKIDHNDTFHKKILFLKKGFNNTLIFETSCDGLFCGECCARDGKYCNYFKGIFLNSDLTIKSWKRLRCEECLDKFGV